MTYRTDPPALPVHSRVRFRSYTGEADIPAITELLQASYAANGETLGVDSESLLHETRNLVRVDPTADMVLGFVGDRLVARSSIDWADTPDGRSRYYESWGDIHPDWRRQGLGTAMWRRNIERLTRLAAEDGFEGERFLTVPWLRAGDFGGRALAKQLGYEQVRLYRHMTRPTLDDIEIAAMPPGLEVRPVTPDDLPAVWDAMTESFRDHFGAFDPGEANCRRWAGQATTDASLITVAFDGDEIAGAVHGVIDPHENEQQGYLRGWTDPIYTRRPWRRRGLAAALIGRTLLALRERGMTSAQLDVDTENANEALTLYERHGFVADRSATEWHRTLSV